MKLNKLFFILFSQSSNTSIVKLLKSVVLLKSYFKFSFLFNFPTNYFSFFYFYEAILSFIWVFISDVVKLIRKKGVFL